MRDAIPPRPDPCLVVLRGPEGELDRSEDRWRKARNCPEDCGRVCIREAGIYDALRFRCEACGQWDLADYDICPKCGRPLGENVMARGPAVNRLWRILHLRPRGNG